jgi:peptidoglycan/LPS O-acetylase OafA/YrhL
MDVTENLKFAYGYLNLVTNPIILEFLAGVLIGRLYLTNAVKIQSRYISYNLLALSISFAVWYAYAGMGDFHGPTKWGWPLAIMVLVMAITSKTINIVAPRILVWLGTISFSLYLTHTTSQHLMTRLLTNLNLEPATHTWGHVFITTAFSISVAAVTHHYLENGLSEAVRRWLINLVRQREKPSDIYYFGAGSGSNRKTDIMVKAASDAAK